MNYLDYAKRSVSWWEHVSFYFMLALDNMGQIFMGPQDAHPGVTISSRSGTAQAHGHRWGCVVCNTLLAVWPFGPDSTGRPHCKQAIENDIKRAHDVLHELEDDPVVQAWLKAE
jgi:hypothetical protein